MTTAYPLTNRELLTYRRRLRRQQIMRRRIAFSILAVFIILLLTFTFGAVISQANSDTAEVSYKYFTSYHVSKGDTLWNIAEEYADAEFYDSVQDYIAEVVAINHIKNDTIVMGQDIIIPYYSTEYR